jgi:PE-PPE domain/PE family
MSYVITQPQMLAAAAGNVAQIGSAISEANAAAAGPTTGVVTAAADEVSGAITAAFNEFGQEYQAVISNAAALVNGEFAQALAVASNGYAGTEAAAQALLGQSLAGGGPTAAANIAYVMGPSGLPFPPPSFVSAVNSLYIQPNAPGFIAQALYTPENLFPTSPGVYAMTFDQSVSQGLTILNNAIFQQTALGNNVTVFGYSQSAVIASLEMRQLAALPPSARPAINQLSFVLTGDPMNPNGGLFERFSGAYLPSLGFSFSGATPDNVYPTTIYTLQYDGYADFPRYPINFVSDLNALMGVAYLHGNYANLAPSQVMPVSQGGQAIQLPTQGPTMTTYYMIPTYNLPLLEPLRSIPFLGNPIADLLQPDMRVIVNLGYGDPDFGYSTAPANVPTPFGLFPSVSPITVLQDLAAGVPQGISQAAIDIGSSSVSGPSLSAPALPDLSSVTNALGNVSTGNLLATTSPTAIANALIGDLQTANTTIGNVLTGAATNSVSALLPAADIALAIGGTLPTYDVNLFLDGIQEAVNGNPMGFVDAIGYPIAADTALVPLSLFILAESTLESAGVSFGNI